MATLLRNIRGRMLVQLNQLDVMSSPVVLRGGFYRFPNTGLGESSHYENDHVKGHYWLILFKIRT